MLAFATSSFSVNGSLLSAATNVSNVSEKLKFQLGTNIPTSVSTTGLATVTHLLVPVCLQILGDSCGFPHPVTAELPQVPGSVQEGRKCWNVNREKTLFSEGRAARG